MYYRDSSEAENHNEITLDARPSIIKKYLLTIIHPLLKSQHRFTQGLPCGRPITVTVYTIKQSP